MRNFSNTRILDVVLVVGILAEAASARAIPLPDSSSCNSSSCLTITNTNTTSGGAMAIRGVSTSSTGVAVRADANGGGRAVHAESVGGEGVYSVATTTHSVFGVSYGTTSAGVYGTNDNADGSGVSGSSNNGTGVLGQSWGSAPRSGVAGINWAAGGYGVFGKTLTSGNGAAIYGDAQNSGSSYAGYFHGQVRAFSYSTASDARLKKEVQKLTYGLREVKLLRPVTYKWKAESSSHRRQLGLIAQEVEQLLPELVQGDQSGTLSVNYQALIPVLINALQEQQAIVRKQEARIAAIESQQTTPYSSMYGLALGCLPLGLFAAWRGRRDLSR